MCDKVSIADLVQTFCNIENHRIEVESWQIERNRKITKLSIKNFQSESLPINLADSFPNLIEFEASGTSFRIVKRENLRNLKKLESLRLESGELLRIRRDSFDDFDNLKVLSLSKNFLTSIPVEIFRQLGNLENLNLSGNNIEEFNSRLFYNLRSLKNLSLDNNKIYQISAQTFYYNRKLKIISFNDNNLRFIDAMVFDGLKEIQEVNLRRNDCIDKEYSVKEMKSGIMGSLRKDVKEVCQLNIKI